MRPTPGTLEPGILCAQHARWPSLAAWDTVAASFCRRTASFQALIATHHPRMPTHFPCDSSWRFFIKGKCLIFPKRKNSPDTVSQNLQASRVPGDGSAAPAGPSWKCVTPSAAACSAGPSAFIGDVQGFLPPLMPASRLKHLPTSDGLTFPSRLEIKQPATKAER